MTDSTTSVACRPQKSEPSLISSTSHAHRGHLMKGDGGGKDNALCSKSYTVEGNNEQCNGCLQVDADFAFSESAAPNQKVVKCTNIDDVCVHSCICHSPHSVAAKTKCLGKVNGVVRTVAEHSSGDNQFLISLRNTCKEEASEIETLNSNYNGDSSQESECLCRPKHLRQADCGVSNEEIGIVKAKECSPEVHSYSEHSGDVDDLVTELEKTSVCHHSSSSGFLTTFNEVINGVTYMVYESEKQMPDIMRLITKDLSEPYSIYTYRYFIHNWPKLCFLAMADDKCVGAIVCKLDLHKKMVRRGYIAMLAVDSEYRRRQIGSTLVTKAIEAMIRDDCDEVVLETEITNQGALHLYENLGFVRDKRLFRYYLNGVDALRLKLWLR